MVIILIICIGLHNELEENAKKNCECLAGCIKVVGYSIDLRGKTLNLNQWSVLYLSTLDAFNRQVSETKLKPSKANFVVGPRH